MVRYSSVRSLQKRVNTTFGESRLTGFEWKDGVTTGVSWLDEANKTVIVGNIGERVRILKLYQQASIWDYFVLFWFTKLDKRVTR